MTFSETDAVPEVATIVRVYEPGTGPMDGEFAVVPIPPQADVTRHADSARNIARCAKRRCADLGAVNNFVLRAKIIAGSNANISNCHEIDV